MRLSREPTDFETGRLVRARLSQHHTGEPSGNLAEAAIDTEYFAADRIEHNLRLITPTLVSGGNVLSDRYDLGTLVYQSVAGLPLEYLLRKRDELNKLGLARRADIYLLVDLEPSTAWHRINSRATSREKFEDHETLARLRARYLEVATVLRDERILRLNGELPESALLEEALRVLSPFFPLIRAQGELPA